MDVQFSHFSFVFLLMYSFRFETKVLRFNMTYIQLIYSAYALRIIRYII